MRYTNLGKVSYLFLLTTVMITVWGLYAWINAEMHHSIQDGFAGFAITIFGGMGIVFVAMMLSIEQERISKFKKAFGFDPRPHKRELVENPQQTVSLRIEQKRLAAQNFFIKEIEFQQQGIANTGFDDKFVENKIAARDAFWQARNTAVVWGFSVPEKITESAL